MYKSNFLTDFIKINLNGLKTRSIRSSSNSRFCVTYKAHDSNSGDHHFINRVLPFIVIGKKDAIGVIMINIIQTISKIID
jgi:hypothetical protein